MATCKCRIYCGEPSLQGIDNYDGGEILYQAQRVYDGCFRHLGRCPAGNTRLFQITNSPIRELRDEHGAEFQLVSKRLVQYCVEQRNADVTTAETLYKEDQLERYVAAVGEYANN